MNARLLRPRLSGDPDALRYIAAVQAADGNTLEPAIRKAITDFVVGCKQDGIWTAIKASCVLMGARTLSGALTPLVGTAPTNNGPFVSGDYDRKTGLIGNGSTKSINTNRANNADPQNSNHNAVYVSTVAAANGTFIASSNSAANANGTNFIGGGQSNTVFARNRSGTGTDSGTISTGGLIASNRSASASYIVRVNGADSTVSVASQSPVTENVLLYQRGGSVPSFSSHRIAFYSVGESLDLALLDSRVSTLYTAIGAAI